MRTRNKPHTKESLLALSKPDGDCLIWQGTKRSNGYGVTVFRGIQTTTHRVMYMLAVGSIEEGMEIDHTCNRRDCINPDHLQAVSHKDNMNLGKARRQTCKNGHPWAEPNTYIATVKRKQGGFRTQRYCRTCRAEYQRQLRNNKGGLIK